MFRSGHCFNIIKYHFPPNFRECCITSPPPPAFLFARLRVFLVLSLALQVPPGPYLLAVTSHLKGIRGGVWILKTPCVACRHLHRGLRGQLASPKLHCFGWLRIPVWPQNLLWRPCIPMVSPAYPSSGQHLSLIPSGLASGLDIKKCCTPTTPPSVPTPKNFRLQLLTFDPCFFLGMSTCRPPRLSLCP